MYTNIRRECMSIHIGQAGIHLGNTCWELFCLEHGLQLDGTLIKETSDNNEIFFYETMSRKKSPRALILNLEPSIIDEIKIGKYRKLYNRKQLIYDKDDASNNYARGYYSLGHDLINVVADGIRIFTEECSSLQGFCIYHSFGDGTGSGSTSLLMETLANNYSKQNKLLFTIYQPSKLSGAVVEPYNTLMTHPMIEIEECVFMIDNDAIFNMCYQKLNINKSTYSNINRLISQLVSSMMVSLRLDGLLNVDLFEFNANLVSYPYRNHFPIVLHAPIILIKESYFGNIIAENNTFECFNNHLFKYEINEEKYKACCLLYQVDVEPKDINLPIANFIEMNKLNFVDWYPIGFKIGINSCPLSVVSGRDLEQINRAVSALCNTTATKAIWSEISYKFDLLFNKRAFLHWFINEGMEQNEFLETREDLASLIHDCEEILTD